MIDTTLDGEQANIALTGELDASTVAQFKREVARVAATERFSVLCLRMQELGFLASAGLGALLEVYRTVSPRAAVVLVDVTDDVRATLEKTGFAKRMTLRSSSEL
ncbi:STAS domain-containing protein [Phaeovibrio sulfidiphilus]|uniref:Anti-sigma factor antagonist n=1 Tax=Phaeovibrio sulfidiphilus TaxID=1220600 RepID=A0A8J7CD39_9PROT|nr:STAS domain-containing protein [Phaeovibrio sulfidiphilus]MBE1236649.1 STAS domain-containing protein [Phaeovibrio sulfidiphilus]